MTQKRGTKAGKRETAAGYTLTEAMLVVALIGAVVALSAPLLMRTTNFWRQSQARADIEADVRIAMDLMNRLLRQGQQSTITIDNAPGQPPYSRLSFTDISNRKISFYQQGPELVVSIAVSTSAPSAMDVVTRNLEFVSFAFPDTSDTSIMSIAMTTQKSTYLGGVKALQLSIEKVRIMNE